jgi:hypothetical protein
MNSVILIALSLCLALPAFATGKGSGANATSVEEAKKKAQMEELKKNMAKYVEEDNFRRQLESVSGGRANGFESNSPSKAESSSGQGELNAVRSVPKSANCGTYEASESCNSAAKVDDDDHDKDGADMEAVNLDE